MTYKMNWDLESIFAGGIHSSALNQRLTTLAEQLTTFQSQLTAYDAGKDAPRYPAFSQLTDTLQKIEAGLLQADVFVTGQASDDITNADVKPVAARVQQLEAQADIAETAYKQLLVNFTDTQFQQLLAQPQMQALTFNLTEFRQQGQELLPPAQEALITQLNIDGLKAWSSHYDSLVATIQVPFHDADGNSVTLSAGQADNQLLGNPDPQYRAELLPQWEAAWAEKEDLFADTLNHLAGARLTDYRAHGTTDFLKRPLEMNRLKPATLKTIWQVVDAHKQPLLAYLQRKAELMGKSRAGWEDVEAPIHVGDFKPHTFTYDEAADFIVKQFGAFSPKMAQLAQYAFDHQWIEAEDRPNKQPGGYMESLPETGESRIFLTFTGSANDASTIAHELGHAFHSSVMTDLPFFRQDYAMNVAETASTFAEMIVADANVREAKTDAEKLTLIDAKMVNPLAMFLNIHARFLFETRFYDARQDHLLTAEELDNMMLQAQKDAFNNSLSSYSPHFWATKLHFYIDDVPFYNFPYVFGYLFSLGIYARAQQSGDFEDQYIALLRDTANMSTEDLAQKHLGVDLTQPDFWEQGVALIEKDIDDFMQLSETLLN
ncbi:M3 family oligoendopeptidase [Secundilactobacillus collinoides]|uniref:Oligoendopeptidase F n=2 Tax=Secundilactobacillus collinoides TaxID=33960 RepID=A0A0R2BEY4_SECCO|nr:M3 family oligoendopeptidase [Secundilactobacillus collinoides]KRM77610.1 oligoendopeptidase F [Secundilactobacillus collinoides DSM 20515 = JCM 1123]KZL43079.1 oligoendopeptidase [Secundilactobacillus collinoides]